MSGITLNSLGSGNGNLVVNFTDTTPSNTVEYVIFILDSSNNIVATDSFSLEEALVTNNLDGSSTIIRNNKNLELVNGSTYSIKIGKNFDLQLVMYDTTMLTCKVFNRPDAPEVYADHSGCKITLNWNKVANNGSPVTQYNIYSAELNTSNLVLNKNWEVCDLSGREIKVPYSNNFQDLYIKINGQYVQSPFGNLRKITTVDYIKESTTVGNNIYVTADGLTDAQGNPIVDIEGELYDMEGDALLDFSGNMISIEADEHYVISGAGEQVLADENLNPILYPDGKYDTSGVPNVFFPKKYGRYNKIQNVAYVPHNEGGNSIIGNNADLGFNYEGEPILNLLSIENVDPTVSIISKLGKLYDLSGNMVYDLSGNSIDAVNMSVKRDTSGQPILTLLKECPADGSDYEHLISNYNENYEKLGYQITKQPNATDVAYLVTAINSAGSSPTLGDVQMANAENYVASQLVFASPEAPSNVEVALTLESDASGMILSWNVPHSNGHHIGGYLMLISDMSGNSELAELDFNDYSRSIVTKINKKAGDRVSLTMLFDNSVNPGEESLYSYFTNSHSVYSGSGISTEELNAINVFNIKNYSFKMITVNHNIDGSNINNYAIRSFRDTSCFSNSASILPTRVPKAVNSVTGTSEIGGIRLTITDTQQDSTTNPILGYVITYMENGQSKIFTTTSKTPLITGLAIGKSYVFRVMARNAKGLGLGVTSQSVTLIGPPLAPVLSVESYTADSIEISWDEPENGGNPITGYEVFRSVNQTMWTSVATINSNTTSYTDTGLTSGQIYYYYVVAININGTGDSSNIVNEYPSAVPTGAVLYVTGINGIVNLRIDDDDIVNNGSPVTTYYIYRRNSGNYDRFTGEYTPDNISQFQKIADTSGNLLYTDTDVQLGIAYLYQVRAVNRDGEGDVQTSTIVTGVYKIPNTNQIVPAFAPDSITTFTARPRFNNSSDLNSTIDLIWTPPNNNGAPIDFYTLDVSDDNQLTWKKYVNAPTQIYARGVDVIDGSSNLLLTGSSFGRFINSGRLSANDSYSYGLEYNTDGSGNLQTVSDGSGNLRMSISANPLLDGALPFNMHNKNSPFDMGKEYAFRLTSHNDAGSSQVSIIAKATPSRQPDSGSLTAEPGDKQVTLTITPPENNGGSQLLKHYIYNSSYFGLLKVVPSGTTSVVIDGLQNSTQYNFVMRTLNKNGFSGNSSTASATPIAVPLAPLNLIQTSENTSVTVTWDAPSNANELIHPFSYEWMLTDGSGSIVANNTLSSSSALSATINNLARATSYTFSVRAINGSINGQYAILNVSTNPFAVPSNPSSILYTPANTSVNVTWSPPANVSDLSNTFNYEWVLTDGSGSVVSSGSLSSSDERNVTINNLTRGTTYTFSVRVVDGALTGEYEILSVSTNPIIVPSLPSLIVYTQINTSINVEWGPPENAVNLTSPFNYEWMLTDASGSIVSSGSLLSTNVRNVTINNLTSGINYTFSVRAVDSSVSGEYATKNITLSSVPSPVTELDSTRSNDTVTVTWQPPMSNGGSPIINYLIVWSNCAGHSSAIVGADTLSYVITSASEIHISVFAINANGLSPMSIMLTQ